MRNLEGAASQRAAAAGAGAAAAIGGFGFFGRIGLRTFGGGAAGLSSANTGLGSTMVVAAVPKSPGLRITWTGTVTGWNLGIAKVTEKLKDG
jgi:ABC-type glycerol-3-phosphate transport system substrate-binding protein